MVFVWNFWIWKYILQADPIFDLDIKDDVEDDII